MPYNDALQDTVTITTISTGFAGGDVVGEEIKTEAVLYNAVKCRLMQAGRVQKLSQQEGKQEAFSNSWLIQMEAQYNGANRGDKASVNNQSYIITKKHEIRGDSAVIHHVVYYLQEQD